MATTIAVRFPLGRYHATPWGRNVNEGVVDWPPEPWRILRALVATAFNRCPELAEEDMWAVISRLADAPVFQVPAYQVAHTRHYLPDRDHRAGVKVSTDKVLDTFAAFDPDDELLVTWPVELDGDERRVLATICERLPYLGRAESLCDARLLDTAPPVTVPDSVAAAADGSPQLTHRAVDLLAPAAPLDPAALTMRSIEIRKTRQLDPPASQRLRYHVPNPAQATGRPAPSRRRAEPAAVTAVRYHVTARALPSRYAALALTDALRAAALSHFGRLHGGGASVRLAGKDSAGKKLLSDHQHAHYLAFSADREGAGGGRLDTLVVWAPGGLEQGDVDALLAVSRLTGRHLAGKGVRPCLLGVDGVGTIDEVAPELAGPAVRWRTATPMAIARHQPRRATLDDFLEAETVRNLAHVGLADVPVQSVEVVRDDALSFRRHRLAESLPQARRAFHVAVTFDRAVSGPLVLGSLSHFGLGLFLPDPT